MDEQAWDSTIADLDRNQLLQLRHKIDQRLASPFEHNRRATFASSASTLYDPGRSTSIASSVSAYSSVASTREGNDRVWSTLSTTTQSTQFPFPPRQEAPGTSRDGPAVGAPVAKQSFFCTFCAELGIDKVIKTKQDWKRHMEDYHGTGLEWRCQVKGCSSVFHRGVEFKKHVKEDHALKKIPRDSKEVRQLERVYACGFVTCRELNKNWKDHCDHVATHMSKGQTGWTYDRIIRNLLKQPRLYTMWKTIRCTPPLDLTHADLTWNSQTTQKLREQLEYHNFHNGIEDFLQILFINGVPKSKMDEIGIRSLEAPTAPHVASLSSTAPTNIHHTQFSLSNAVLYQPRNSVHMTDALPLNMYDNLVLAPEEPLDIIPYPGEELYSFQEFINQSDHETSHEEHAYSSAAATTPVDDSPTKHSRRNLVRKSKEWLAGKKSLHHSTQPGGGGGGVERPDVPLSPRPVACPRKRS